MAPLPHNNALRIYIPASERAVAEEEFDGSDVDMDAEHSSEGEPEQPGQGGVHLQGHVDTSDTDGSVGLGGARAYINSELREEVTRLRRQVAARRARRDERHHANVPPDRGDTPNSRHHHRRSPAPEPPTPRIRLHMRAIGRSLRGSRVDDEDNARYLNLPRGLRRELELAFHQYPPGVRDILRPERILEVWNNRGILAWQPLTELPGQLRADLLSMERRVHDHGYAPDMRGAETSFVRLN